MGARRARPRLVRRRRAAATSSRTTSATSSASRGRTARSPRDDAAPAEGPVVTRARHALDRHLALAGFMGAGKTTVGREVATRLGRRFVDLDDEIERRAGATISELFAAGESGFRRLEAEVAAAMLAEREPTVIALGGGAVLDAGTQALLARQAFTVLLDVDPRTAWGRVEGRRSAARDRRGHLPPTLRRAAGGLRRGRRRACARRRRGGAGCGRACTCSSERSRCSATSSRATGRSRSSPTRTSLGSTA